MAPTIMQDDLASVVSQERSELMTTAVGDLRSEVTTVVRESIASIKEVDVALIEDDAPLFRSEAGAAPLVELDSLDALDLALELKERFDPDGDTLDSLFRDNPDPMVFATVDHIVDFLLSALPAIDSGPTAAGDAKATYSRRG
jgi:acyl carrier protein